MADAMTDLDTEIARLERELYRLKAQRTELHRAEHCRRIHADPAVRAKQAASMKATWSDPEKRARMVAAMNTAAGHAKRSAAARAAAKKRRRKGEPPPIPTLAELVGA